MHVLNSLSAFLLGRTSYYGYKHQARIKGVEAYYVASPEIFNSSQVGPPLPVVSNRVDLFNLPTIEDRENIDADGTNLPSSNLPAGLQRYEPTVLRDVLGSNNIENGFIEEVDQFRFVVDKEEFKRSIASKTAMKVKQRSQAGLVDHTREFYIDPSILMSPDNPQNSDAVPAQFNLDMEYATFRNSVLGTGDEVDGIANARGQENSENEVNVAYDPARMLEAEQTVRSHTAGAADKIVSRIPHRNSDNTVKVTKFNQRRDANVNVLKSLALTSQCEIGSDIIGVLATTIAAYGIFAAYEIILRYMAKSTLFLSAIVSRFVRRLHVPTVLRRNKVAVYVASSAVLMGALVYIWRYRRDRNRYGWVGYS